MAGIDTAVKVLREQRERLQADIVRIDGALAALTDDTSQTDNTCEPALTGETLPRKRRVRRTLSAKGAVGRVLRDRPEEVFTSQEVKTLVAERFPQVQVRDLQNSVHSALSRLVSEGAIKRLAGGRYQWRDASEDLPDEALRRSGLPEEGHLPGEDD